MFTTITQFIAQHNLIKQNDTIIVGLSGGPDSVFLLHFLLHIKTEYNLTIIAAHLNHEWRPEAAQEEELCKNMAEKYAIPFVSQKLSTIAHALKKNGSQEEFARKARRMFLEHVAHEHQAHAIALGHHAQDQQETFFIRLMRGSSLTGLTCMSPRNGLYIRPLLETSKKDIIDWLDEHKIAYAHDNSNDSHDYLRNRIRHVVLPALRSCDPRFDHTFLTTLTRLQETEQVLNRMTHATLETLSMYQNGTRHINITRFMNIDHALHHRIILAWLMSERVPFVPTHAFFDEITRFLTSPRGGKHTLHTQWSIIKKQGMARITHA